MEGSTKTHLFILTYESLVLTLQRNKIIKISEQCHFQNFDQIVPYINRSTDAIDSGETRKRLFRGLEPRASNLQMQMYRFSQHLLLSTSLNLEK